MPKQKQKIIQTYQDKRNVETFDKERCKYAFQRYKHKVEANFLKKTIDSMKKSKIKILDVACGTGRMLPEVFSLKKEIEYRGFDSSEEMTKHLKEKAKKIDVRKNVKVKLGDASNLPFSDNEFDIVFSYHLLWHIPKEEQEKIIKEMLRVCKKDGIIIFDTLNKNFIYEKIKGFISERNTSELYKLTINEIKTLFEFKNIEIEKLNDFPIKNDSLYKIVNILNYIRNILPKSLYHMIFFRVKK